MNTCSVCRTDDAFLRRVRAATFLAIFCAPALAVAAAPPEPPPSSAPDEALESAEESPADAPNSDGEPSGPPPGLVMPVLEREVSFEYPEALAQQPEPPSGSVVVRFVVDVDGGTKEAEVTQSVAPEIDAAALEAIASLKYRPATFEGNPVELVLSMTIEVSPPEPAPPEPQVGAEPDVEAEDEPEPVPSGPVRVRGRVLQAGERQPLEGAVITVYPAGNTKLGRIPYRKRKPPTTEPAWTAGTRSEADGSFELRDVQEGRLRVVIMTQGYERLEYVVELGDNEVLELEYYQVRLNTNPYRTEVETEADAFQEVRRHKLEPEELAKLPGTNGDALKAVQNFPGVARAPFGLGQLVLRGAAPADSRVYLAGHEVPSLFHFGGLTSVFNSSLIESMELVPGNFDSRYGNAIGGVVNVETRKGRRDGFHGYVKADVFDAAGVVEGPIGKGSFALSVRRSYIDAILPAVLPSDGNLSFSVAPRYYDYSGSFDYPLAGGNFTARVLGSDDRLTLIDTNENDDDAGTRGTIGTVSWFHRADLAYEKRWRKWSFFISPSYRRDHFSLDIGEDARFGLETDRFSGRAEVTREVGKRSSWRLGTEVITDWFTVDIKSPPPSGNASGPRGGSGSPGGDSLSPVGSNYRVFIARPSLYSTFRWGITDRFAVSPGLRLTYLVGDRNSLMVDPRLSAEVKATDTTTITAAAGIYSQLNYDVTNARDFGNPDLDPDKAMHVSLGVAQDFGAGWNASATGFYKHLWSLAATTDEVVEGPDGQLKPLLFDDTGVGRVYGGELMVRKEMTGNLYGWAAYTLSRSEVQQRSGEPFELFGYDQTHVFTLLSAYRLPRNWQIGLRFRVASGNPYTPIHDGVAQLREGLQFGLPADNNSARFRAFHQLDLRVDKTWTFQRVALDAYLDVQNVYNAKNPEFLEESWNYQRQTTINSLPIIPSIGLKLTW
ncbi:MAG: TonB family protein [Nannocystales bacterium]